MPAASCAAAILAGGSSVRMGADKAGLRIGGTTLLAHMRSILAAAGLERIYVSRAGGVEDVIAGCGPLSGVHAVLARALGRHAQVLFVPVDMPGLTAQLAKRLAAAPDDEPLVRFARHKLPFRLRAQQCWLELAERALSDGKDMSLARFQRGVPQLRLAVLPDAAGALRNINTQQQWRQFTASRR